MPKSSHYVHLWDAHSRGNSFFETSSVLVFLLSLIWVIGSISRFPLLDEIEEFRIGVVLFGIFGVFLFWVAVPRRYSARTWLVVATVLVMSKLVIGAMLANLYFDQSFLASIQEARFGLIIAATPLAYNFLAHASSTTLKKFIGMYIVAMVCLDFLVFSFFSEETLLVLGSRTEARFVCSVMIPIVVTATLLIRYEKLHQVKQINFLLATTLVMLLHSVLMTTSRLESLLSAGLLCWIIIMRWPTLRLLLYSLLALLAFADIGLILSTESQHMSQNLAGRNIDFAIHVASEAMPFGFGLVNDVSAKSILQFPQDFYFSDYGLLLYIFRYGLVGVAIGLGLLMYWVYFVLHNLNRKGILIFSLCLLVYLSFVPLVDYGGMSAGFVLAWMWYAAKKNTNSITPGNLCQQ